MIAPTMEVDMDVVLVIICVSFLFYMIVGLLDEFRHEKIDDLNESLIKAKDELIKAKDENIHELKQLVDAMDRRCSALEEKMRLYAAVPTVSQYVKCEKEGEEK